MPRAMKDLRDMFFLPNRDVGEHLACLMVETFLKTPIKRGGLIEISVSKIFDIQDENHYSETLRKAALLAVEFLIDEFDYTSIVVR